MAVKTNIPDTARILIVANGKIFGPFPDQGTAEAWATSHQVKSDSKLANSKLEMYSFWQRDEGTADTAHECGTQLRDLDEVLQRDRKTSAL